MKNNSMSIQPGGPTSPTALGPSRTASIFKILTKTKSVRDRIPYQPNRFDVYMLGLTIVIGGQYFSWNAGLAAGIYSYFGAFLLISSAYITLCCCVAEVTGSLPFAGGAYGLSRCTLGFMAGFLIGSCEALEYIVYVATSVVSFASMVVMVVPSLAKYQLLICAGFYLSTLCFHIKGDATFWRFNKAIGIVSLLIVFLYVFGGIPSIHSPHSPPPWEVTAPGVSGFMKMIPIACWFFVGIESLGLASDQVPNPKSTIPYAQIACVFTLFITGIAVFFISVALPPLKAMSAPLPIQLVPYNNAFVPLFKCTEEIATLLSLPATYATAFGFMWSYGKLISAMAQSKLLPPVLGRTSERYGTPVMGICFGASLSFGMCVLVILVPAISRYLFIICILCAFMSYIGQCIGYISLRRNYKNIKSSSFTNPFGMAGAVYSMVIWILGIISITAFQGNGGVETQVFGWIVLFLIVYYHGYAKKRQTFSAEENKVLLVAHVMKFNGNRTRAMSPQARIFARVFGFIVPTGNSKVSHKSHNTSKVSKVSTNHSNHSGHNQSEHEKQAETIATTPTGPSQTTKATALTKFKKKPHSNVQPW